MESRLSTFKLFHSKVLINNKVFSLIIDNYGAKNLVSRKLVNYLNLPIEFCSIRKTQVCWVPISIGKSYKREVFCYLDDMEDCHIRLGKSWRQEVQGFYDLGRNLYFFLWEGKKIAMAPSEVKPQLSKLEVIVEDKILKDEIVEEYVEKVQESNVTSQHEDKISTLVLETTKEVGVLNTCDEEVAGSKVDVDVKNLENEATKSLVVKGTQVCDFDCGFILNMIIKNLIKFSMTTKKLLLQLKTWWSLIRSTQPEV